MNICRICLAEILSDSTTIDCSLDGERTIAEVIGYLAEVDMSEICFVRNLKLISDSF